MPTLTVILKSVTAVGFIFEPDIGSDERGYVLVLALPSIPQVNDSELAAIDIRSDVVTPCAVPKYNTNKPLVASYVALLGVIDDPFTTLTALALAETNV